MYFYYFADVRVFVMFGSKSLSRTFSFNVSGGRKINVTEDKQLNVKRKITFGSVIVELIAGFNSVTSYYPFYTVW